MVMQYTIKTGDWILLKDTKNKEYFEMLGILGMSSVLPSESRLAVMRSGEKLTAKYLVPLQHPSFTSRFVDQYDSNIFL